MISNSNAKSFTGRIKQWLGTCLRHFPAVWLALFVYLPNPASAGDVVYNNSVNDLRNFFGPGVEFGDEIILASPLGTLQSCTITAFTFDYVGQNFMGNERAQLRFYRNDGPLFGTVPKPGTLLYDSGPFNIIGAKYGFALRKEGLNVNVPSSFTWTIEFINVSGNEVAGLSLYSPPVLGNNYGDYWERSGTDWELKEVPGIPVSFGAILEATNVVVKLSRPLMFKSLGLNGSDFSFRLTGPAATKCVVETSTNSMTWNTLTNFTLGTNAVIISEKPTANLKLFRARLVP